MSLRELSCIPISQIPKTRELYAIDEPIELISPFMRVAFVERDRFGQMFIKLEFTDVGQNKSMNSFYTIIHTLERVFYKKLCYMLNLKPETCLLTSQIYKNPQKKYDPILTLKIPKKKGKNYIDATIVNSTRRTFYDVRQHDFVRVKIFAKCLWTNTRKLTMKWNIQELEFKDPDTDDEQDTQRGSSQEHSQQRNSSNGIENPNTDNNNPAEESKYNHREYYKKQPPQGGGGHVGYKHGNFRNSNMNYAP